MWLVTEKKSERFNEWTLSRSTVSRSVVVSVGTNAGLKRMTNFRTHANRVIFLRPPKESRENGLRVVQV